MFLLKFISNENKLRKRKWTLLSHKHKESTQITLSKHIILCLLSKLSITHISFHSQFHTTNFSRSINFSTEPSTIPTHRDTHSTHTHKQIQHTNATCREEDPQAQSYYRQQLQLSPHTDSSNSLPCSNQAC